MTLLCINVIDRLFEGLRGFGVDSIEMNGGVTILDCEGLVSTYQLWDVPDTERDLNEAPVASDAHILAAVVIRVSQVDQHLCDEQQCLTMTQFLPLYLVKEI